MAYSTHFTAFLNIGLAKPEMKCPKSESLANSASVIGHKVGVRVQFPDSHSEKKLIDF
jgi:hypothetical protein